MKKHWKKIVVGVAIIAVLAVSFLIGGGGSAGTRDADGLMAATDTGVGQGPDGLGPQGPGTGGAVPGASSDMGGAEQTGNSPLQQGGPQESLGVTDALPPAEGGGEQGDRDAGDPSTQGGQPGDNGGQGAQGGQPGENGDPGTRGVPGAQGGQEPGGAPDPGATGGNGEQQGAPDPEPLQGNGGQQEGDPEREMTVTLTISLAALLDNMDLLNSEKAGLVPENGIIFSGTVVFYEGESVFNVLLREVRRNRIHMEHANNPIYDSAYIEGIGNIYEFDAGEGSGWLYCVNGVFPNYGSSRYILQDGDRVGWFFTCNRGADVGGGGAAGSYNWG